MSMELDHSFTVPVPPNQAWDVLLDVAQVAPCMPGATIDTVDGDVVTGSMKVKVGPVSLTYKGTAKFTERDESSRTVLVEASGKETRGTGTASATVRAELRGDDDSDGTKVNIHTVMNVTGRPAQFGRGIIAEVGGKLIQQFADNLALQLASDTKKAPATDASAGGASPSGTDSASGADTPSGTDTATGVGTASGGGSAPEAVAAPPAGGVSQAETAEALQPQHADSINLVRLVGPVVLKRVIPVAAVGAAFALLFRRVRRLVTRRREA
jgi:carbon monoxide dehydrogenase subunit G